MADFTALKTAIQTYVKQNGNEEITGDILQGILLSIVTTLGDNAINNLQETVDSISSLLENGAVYCGIATPSTNLGTPTTKVFYIALQAGTYTNFGNLSVVNGVTILSFNGSTWSKQLLSYGDGVFDISEYKATGGTLATFTDLAAALGTDGANVPAEVRRGGMSVKFVQSSDNKYIQARCMAQNFTTDVTQWQGVDDEPIAGSDNLVKSGGVAKQFGIVDKADVVGNNSNWVTYRNSNIIIKAGESVKIVFTGPITFAGTNTTDTFLSVYWRTRTSSMTHYILTKQGNVGTIDNLTVDFTATEDCYLCFEGRWHDTETLHILVCNGLTKQVEDNKANITTLQNQVSALPASIKAEQDKISRGTTRVISCSQISFDNTMRKASIASAIVANPSNTDGRLTIPAAEVPYDFNISSTSEWWLVYNVADEEYKFMSAGTTTANDIVIACLSIQGLNPTSIITEIRWCAIQNYSLNGVNIQTQINDNKEAIQENKQDIISLNGLLESNYTNQPLYNIVKGTIYNGYLDTSSNEYLAANSYIAVYPNTKIHCIHASDISIRIIEFDSSKSFIKQKGYDKFDYLVLSENTHFVKICADYSERGYGSDNPISPSAYQEGDFGVEIIESKRLKITENACRRLIDDYEDKFYFVDGSTWTNGRGAYKVRVIPVVGKGTIFCKANPNVTTRIAFLNSFDEESIIANLPVAVDGTGNQNTNAGQTRTYDIPASCSYIAISSCYDNQNALPDVLIIDGVSYVDNTKKLLIDNIDKTQDIENAIGGIDTELVENFTIRKGTIWNGAATADNACLYGEEYFEVAGGSVIEVFSADYVKTRISEYDANKVYLTYSGSYAFLNKIKLNKNTRFIRISALYIDDTYTAENPITVEHFTQGDFSFKYKKIGYDLGDIVNLNKGIFSSIIGRNIHRDASVRATGVKAVNDDIKPFSFIHISDIHTKGDNYKCFENACEFLQHYSNIKCMIATGDLVWDTYHDPTTWYDKALAKTSKPVLNVIGNHDAGQYNSAYGLGSQSSDLECYNKFIAPYVNAGTLPNGITVPGWGVIQPTNAATEGKSYYYKDFADEKVRLIVLNEFETDYELNQEGTGLVYSREFRAMRQAQFDWLIASLNSTPDDYGVIVAYHQPDNLIDEHNEFVSFDLVDDYILSHGGSHIANIYAQSSTGRNALPAILNAFKNKSALDFTFYCNGAVPGNRTIQCDFTNVQAEFICILNGHTHRDYIGHLKDFPSIPVLVVGADNLKYTSSFQPRQEGTPSEDLFNVVNIDRNRKTIKIIRIGSDASVTGQVRDQMIMSYATT